MLGLIAARLAPSHGLTREAPLFDPPSPRAQTYLWRATVREFEEVNRGRQLSVAVRIDASIVRARDDSVVWTASLGRERAVTEGQDMPAVVRALSALATGVVQELLGRAARELAVPAADSARRTP
jgi:ABC-type uncharacterized transport system auxiliary subunit